MRRGFTMIELVFVIVILGILASIAIPRLAASRDDARAVSLKQDISTMTQAVPAWYQGQREVTIQNAISLDTTLWQKTPNSLEYTYNDGSAVGTIEAVLCTAPVGTKAAELLINGGAVVCDIIDDGDNNGAEDEAVVAAIDGGSEPWLIVELTPDVAGIVRTLVRDMNVTNQTIPMAGRRVIWN